MALFLSKLFGGYQSAGNCNVLCHSMPTWTATLLDIKERLFPHWAENHTGGEDRPKEAMAKGMSLGYAMETIADKTIQKG